MEEAVCVISYDQFTVLLHDALRQRLQRTPPPADAKRIRSPVCLLFVRPRADKQAPLLAQAKTSFKYWHYASGSALDIALPGWRFDHSFNAEAFAAFEDEMCERTRWAGSAGETTALVLDCVVTIADMSIELDYSQVLLLPVGQMISDGKIESLDRLIGNLIRAAKNSRNSRGSANVWEMSDGLGIQTGAKCLWQILKNAKYIESAVKVIDEVRDYAICDLRKRA